MATHSARDELLVVFAEADLRNTRCLRSSREVSIERVSGDVRSLRGSWVLTTEGDYTIAHYTVDLTPGFWVPHWLVRSALKHDLPKMLRALRNRAEELDRGKPN